MIQVGVALVHRGGRYLIRRRPEVPGSPMPGYWEFPGGKSEPGESPEEAAVRECREETGMAVAIVGLRRRHVHHYPHGTVELHYFDCEPLNADAEPSPDSGFQWARAVDLPRLQFPEANEPVLNELAAERKAQ